MCFSWLCCCCCRKQDRENQDQKQDRENPTMLDTDIGQSQKSLQEALITRPTTTRNDDTSSARASSATINNNDHHQNQLASPPDEAPPNDTTVDVDPLQLLNQYVSTSDSTSSLGEEVVSVHSDDNGNDYPSDNEF